jgi:hypothetical protein
MAGLVYLCLEAAPGYISSRSFRPPSTSSNHRISSEHSSPSLSQRGLEFSTSPVALAAIPSSTKTLEVYFLLAALRISTTLQPGSSLFPPSLTFFTFSLSEALDLELSTVPVSSPCPPHWLQSPPLRSTLEVYSLLAALHISTTLLRLDSTHDRRLMNSIDHRIVRLHRRRSIELDRPRIPLQNLLPPSSPSLLLVSLLVADILPTIQTSWACTGSLALLSKFQRRTLLISSKMFSKNAPTPIEY